LPQIVILAGPNGAGKSTLAARFVPPGVPFLNADNIARALTPAPGQNADLAAGRLLLARIDEAVQARTSFALETNLANRTLATRIPRWQASGYRNARKRNARKTPSFKYGDISASSFLRRHIVALRTLSSFRI
jgi:predicted ABC-type ATPase